MKKKKIGILLRKDMTYHLNLELMEVLLGYDVIPLGIVNDKLEDMIESSKLCDGFILQGGRDYQREELQFVKYLYEQDIPTFGICLGMQMMGVMKDGIFDKLSTKSHQSTEKYVHEVFVNKNSKLYSIVSREKILVNSRHSDYVKETKLDIGATDICGLIEEVEDKDKTFFLGVQWHPESLMDIPSQKLFESFLHSIN